MDSEAGEPELKWFGTVNNRAHISLFTSEEEYVAIFAEKEPDVIVFSVSQLDYITREDDVKMYLLAEENMTELATRTGVSEKVFRDMWRWDNDLGVISKIYLIPEKSI